MLSVSQLDCSFGEKQALRGISFNATTGISVFLGANGAGKTTLFRILATLQEKYRGIVRLDETEYCASQVSTIRYQLGYMDQFATFSAQYTVYEALAYAAWLKGVPRHEYKTLITTMLEQSDLLSVADCKLRALSGGMKQRVYLLQALVNNPHLLILDEPCSGLDPLHQEKINALLKIYAQNSIVLLSTHSLDQALAIADWVFVMNNGRLIAQCENSAQLTRTDLIDLMSQEWQD
ncbi:ABC transporter ATP-binding protein [Arcanobacterium bovis]|uniref:ATP-binding cassette domain-containing protein n=1 Tax=Arcanobacterium bovis TaxID=2529275 RepID=A0A4Q9UZH3_9ACTO|nr:ATP-binding cassette domain-containing protein [Arcanobacterium bovis]TBW21390.1 ATP-binding cassette domain-containing protein [Arcanobacterium bovis]